MHSFLDLRADFCSARWHHTLIAVQTSHRDTDQLKSNLFSNLSHANISSSVHPTHRGRANYDNSGFTWLQYAGHFSQTACHFRIVAVQYFGLFPVNSAQAGNYLSSRIGQFDVLNACYCIVADVLSAQL